MARLSCLVWSGLVLFYALYIFQALALTSYMVMNIDTPYWIFIPLFLPALMFFSCFGCLLPKVQHERSVRYVWIVWLLYTIILVPAVAIIFAKAVPELKPSDTFGPNVLKTILCITPVLLILLLNVTISPPNRRFIERVSTSAALDLFDSIEMLAIILEQKQFRPGSFELDSSIETAIIVFVCISLFISPFVLFQHKVRFGEVSVRKKTMVARTSVQIFLVNLTFLVMRFIVWFHYDYDASIFITKNIISIVISGIEISSVFGFFNCGVDNNETFNV
ncbi:uncharacterized protein LOC114526069 [Dendronephthya gigantea]|uniref:uncharacterized protein LOC114526069 n=1 Tax=Dendronephthya gigantea TaxID=151771 RepID=UPI00106B0251|nr:uncharacterized protein LOC114526069 [Dendronephthya gigantea]